MTRLRRGVILLLVVGALPTLTACVAPIPPQLTVGSCLRTTAVEYSAADVVPCSTDHFADYLGGTTWPGFDGVIAAHGVRRTFDAIYHDASDSFVAEYKGWTQQACNDHLDRIADVDWVSDDLSDYYPHIDELGLVPVGPFMVEAALGTRAEFLAGDHATRCRLTWLDSNDVATRVRYPRGVALSGMFDADFPSGLRLCFSAVHTEVLCAGKHTKQDVFEFDARAALGDDFLAKPFTLSDGQWDQVISLCSDLLDEVVPADIPNAQVWTSMIRTPAWRDAGPLPPNETSYPIYCGVDGDDDTLVGDLFTLTDDSST